LDLLPPRGEGGTLLAKIFTLDQAPKSNLVCIEYPV
jgi:hypothetical protein